ncbi:uncharacterized protein LOC120388175 isoform X2 [Mauremys reevesii]|nr:uncharacterized protein LOC120388175 isoform X2 [Mauremys reevesii]
MQHPLNISERFAMLYWSPALAGTWMKIAVIHSGKSNPYNSSFARHISVSKGRFIVTNASKAIAGNLKIVHEMDERECLASIRLNVAEPAPTSAPASLARDDRLNRTAAGEPGSQPSYIVAVVVGTMVALLVLVLALGLWQRNNIARHIRWFSSHLGFPARATPFQQAGDTGPMQELMQTEDASGGDRSAVPNGELLGSAEMLYAGGLESDEPPPLQSFNIRSMCSGSQKSDQSVGPHKERDRKYDRKYHVATT